MHKIRALVMIKSKYKLHDDKVNTNKSIAKNIQRVY